MTAATTVWTTASGLPNVRGRSTVLSVLLIAGAIVILTFFFGLVAVFLPWWFVVAFAVLLLLVLATIVFPEQAIVALLMMGSGLIPSGVLPTIPLGPGRILAADVLISVLICYAVARAMQRPERLRHALAWFRPVAVLVALTAVGIAVGLFMFHSPLRDVFQEARAQMYWLVAPLIVSFAYDEKRMRRLMWGLIFVGMCLSVAVIAQFISGRPFIENARVERLTTLSLKYNDVTRSTAGGAIYLILLPLFYLLARSLGGAARTVYTIPILSVLAAGVVVSFGRAIWLATFVAILLLAVHLKGIRGLVQITVAAIVCVVLSVGGLVALKPKTVDAAYERLISTFEEGSHKSSLGWRFEEVHFAMKELTRSPLLGIGYGTPYKPYIPLSGIIEQDVSLMRYAHNAYIAVWLKLGIPGLVTILWLAVATFRRGVRLVRTTTDDRRRAVCSAALAGFFVAIVTSVTQPEWVVGTGIMFFGLVVGLLAACDVVDRDRSS